MAGASHWRTLSSLHFDQSHIETCDQRQETDGRRQASTEQTQEAIRLLDDRLQSRSCRHRVCGRLDTCDRSTGCGTASSGLANIGGLDGGQFIVIFLGGFIGLIIMRFAASYFVKAAAAPGLEVAAFLIVGWVGVKLAVITLAHPDVALIDHHFPESSIWKASFYIVLVLIAVIGWFSSSGKVQDEDNAIKEVEDQQPGKTLQG